MTTIAITGASGLIGRHLCEHFHARGWEVRALLRRPEAYAGRDRGITSYRLDLPLEVPVDALRGADVVVHAAYATRATGAGTATETNAAGTERLVAAARAAGVPKFVFISSLSARPDAVSYYGASKLALEGRLDLRRDLVVRPGLVLAADGGLGLRMWRAVETMRLAPVFDGGAQVIQTVHIDDLCAAFEAALTSGATGVVNVAEPAGLTMRELLDAFAEASGAQAVTLPLPAGPMLALLRGAERLGVPSPVSSDNLLGLLTMRAVDTAPDIARLGIRVRSARQSIAAIASLLRSGGRS